MHYLGAILQMTTKWNKIFVKLTVLYAQNFYRLETEITMIRDEYKIDGKEPLYIICKLKLRWQNSHISVVIVAVQRAVRFVSSLTDALHEFKSTVHFTLMSLNMSSLN
jgi:hypothetical protein